MSFERDSRKLRDYGLGDPEDFGGTDGPPRVVGPAEGIEECPNCKCKTVFNIEVNVNNRMLRGGKGIGRYFGCACCPWASPCLSTTTAGPREGK
jgi:hypothetical protein